VSDRDLSIDPESPALQYEIVQDGWGRWRLERAHPEVPRTPDENLAVAEARNVLPTDEHDRLYVPDALHEELDAEPGDVVSLVTVVSAWVSVFVDTMSAALQPLMESIANAAEEFARGVADAFSGLGDAGDEEDSTRDGRLPESIREARERREQQRESTRDAVGWDDRADGA